uniref:F-box protein AT5G49610-like beta-propeller domain-containing protein n=1 Tax=Aegilops tauschii TaxID=37682 RepID=R7WF83_AEGTA
MASHPSSPPPGHRTPPAPITISDLGDDQLREIFLRLPDVPSLASAAFTCRGFLGAVRSSRAFRRRFRALHAPPLLPRFPAHMVAPFHASRHPSAGFTPLQDDDTSDWRVDLYDPSVLYNYNGGCIAIKHRSAKHRVWYNPQTMALLLRPKDHHDMPDGTTLGFHTFCSEDDQMPSRVVCVRHDYSRPCARVAVFSSDTMEWQIFPETATPLPHGLRSTACTVLDGFICWQCGSMSEVHVSEYIFVLKTDTFQFSQMNLPPPLRVAHQNFKIGQTTDGKLCIVNEKECMFSMWILTAGDDGIEKFVLHKMFPLHASFMEITSCSVEDTISVQLLMVFNGFVYFVLRPWKNYVDQCRSPEWFLSLSLETAELKQHLKNGKRLGFPVHPYSAWPPILQYISEDSKSEVTVNGVEDVGSESTEKDSSILIKALRSYKEGLIKDGDANVAEIEAFSLCIDVEDEKNSLVRKIVALDELLLTVRDRVLRAAADSEFADSEFCRQKIKTESWWQMCKVKLWRAFCAK